MSGKISTAEQQQAEFGASLVPLPQGAPEVHDAAEQAAGPLTEAIRIMARLRGPDGCPWDREQTFDSIKKHTLEETYEVFDAIERSAWPDLRDELGDLLLQVFFYAQMASEAGYFTLADVAAALSSKLIRRHPHVFSGVEASDSDAVVRNWEQIKQAEKSAAATGGKLRSMLDDIPRAMPAMMEATKLGSRAAKVGFDWPNAAGLFDKLAEETKELETELSCSPVERTKVEQELGDLLFTAVNLSRHLKVDPESALRSANAKFRARFTAMEEEAGGREGLNACSPDGLERLWRKAKQREHGDPDPAYQELPPR
jgi:ATP diphosphatase